MKKILYIFLFTATLSSTMFAALPPFAQSKKEIMAILNSSELTQYFSSADIIQSIKHYGSTYTIASSHKEVVVDVIYPSTDERKIGPIDFQLLFHPANLP